MTSFKRRRRLAGWALGGLVVATFAAAIAAYGYYALDWGCPSQAELQRPLATQEVTNAFAQGGLQLDPAQLPVALPPGARAYHHPSENATLFVVVCDAELRRRRSCDDPLPDLIKVDFATDGGPPQRMRSGVSLLNLFTWATDADNQSAKRLMKRVYPITDDLDRNPSPDDRCYVR